MKTSEQRGFGVSAAIVIAGVLVAGSIALSINYGGDGSSRAAADDSMVRSQESVEFRTPDETDHVRGDREAPITIVEFSDFECPFCGRLHPTLARIVEENDDVAWAYRHFPLNSNSNAFDAAVASECVAKLGGNDAFWDFADSAFESQRNLGDQFYNDFVRSAGIDAEEFASCQTDQSIVENVQDDLDEVVAVGGRGTPHVVVVTPSDNLIPFSGALPYEQVTNIIEQARNN